MKKHQETCVLPRLRLLGLLAGLTAGAPANGAEPHLLHYTARLLGVPLLDITYCVELDQRKYASAIEAHTVGLAEFLVHGRSAAIAHGAIRDLHVLPMDYEETGRLKGEANHIVIGYSATGPVLKAMSPPAEKYRIPVPADKLPGSMDGLSAIALEILVASDTNACQGTALVYDGLQLRRGTTHTAGFETLKASPRNLFSGPALTCTTKSEMLGGFLKDKPIEPQSKPRFSTAWLGRMTPDGLMLPVKLSFDADFLGDIVVDLDKVGVAAEGCTGKISGAG